MNDIPIEKITIRRQQIHAMDCECRECSPLWWAPSVRAGIGCVVIAAILIGVNLYHFS